MGIKITGYKQESGVEVKGFIFYRAFHEAIETLSEKNKLIAYKAITEYALNGEEATNLPLRVLAILKIAMPNIDANRRKYFKKLEKESQSSQKETISIFEEEVLLPKKEKMPIEIKDDDDFEDISDDDYFEP